MASAQTGAGTTLRGFGVPLPSFTYSTLDTAESQWTEAGPRPGSPVGVDEKSKLSPVLSGNQQQNVDLSVTRAGGPLSTSYSSLYRAGALAYRIDGESSTLWRGYSWPGYLNRWEALSTYASSPDIDIFDIALIPSTQQVIALGTQEQGNVEPFARTRNPATRTWATAVDLLTDPASSYFDLAMMVLPDERVVVLSLQNNAAGSDLWTAYYSDDAGGTWAPYSVDPFGFAGAVTSTMQSPLDNFSMVSRAQKSRAVCRSDGQCLFVRKYNDGSRGLRQYASSNFGASWTFVDSWTASAPEDVALVALASGAYLLIYVTGANELAARRVASAFDVLESASTISISGTATCLNVTAWQDADGIVHVLVNGSAGRSRRWVSLDDGRSYIESGAIDAGLTGGAPWACSDANTRLGRLAAAPSQGEVVVLHNSTDGSGGGTYDYVLGCMTLGGWSNVEVRGWDATTEATGETWLPFEAPDTISTWTATGAGTFTLTSPGVGQYVTAANTKYYTASGPVGYPDTTVLFEVAHISGTGSTTANRVAVRAEIGDGVTIYGAAVNFTTTSATLRDLYGASSIATISLDMTTPKQFLLYLNGSTKYAELWYRSPDDTNWTYGAAGTVTGSASATTTRIQWGHIASGTCTSNWAMLCYRHSLAANGGKERPGYLLANLQGRPMTTTPYPVAGIGDATGAAFLSVAGSPGRYGETWDIDRAFDYPFSACFWDVSPSPAAKWRSTTDAADVYAVYDAGMVTSLGTSTWFLYVDGANFKTILIQGWDGATWTTIKTLNLANDALTVDWARTGNTVTPGLGAAPVASGGRHLQFGEAVGGTFDLNGDLRKISRNDEGVWAHGDGVLGFKQARIWLDGIDGTEATSGTSNGSLWLPRGTILGFSVDDVYSKVRWKIAAQSTADGYFEAGVIAVGAFFPLGRQYSRGFRWAYEPNVQRTVDAFGTERARQRGPTPRTLTLQWQDGQDWTAIRNNDPNYLDGGGDRPLATWNDVATKIQGIIDDCKGGQIPCLVVMDTYFGLSQMDRTLFLWGRFQDAPEVTHVVGEERASEFVRTGSLSIRELV